MAYIDQFISLNEKIESEYRKEISISSVKKLNFWKDELIKSFASATVDPAEFFTKKMEYLLDCAPFVGSEELKAFWQSQLDIISKMTRTLPYFAFTVLTDFCFTLRLPTRPEKSSCSRCKKSENDRGHLWANCEFSMSPF